MENGEKETNGDPLFQRDSETLSYCTNTNITTNTWATASIENQSKRL